MEYNFYDATRLWQHGDVLLFTFFGSELELQRDWRPVHTERRHARCLNLKVNFRQFRAERIPLMWIFVLNWLISSSYKPGSPSHYFRRGLKK